MQRGTRKVSPVAAGVSLQTKNKSSRLATDESVSPRRADTAATTGSKSGESEHFSFRKTQ
jgi:hypothetical protein